MDNQLNVNHAPKLQKPSAAFIGASWAALAVGVIAYLIGLYNADMQLNEKGYYFTVLAFGLFASISLQKVYGIELKTSQQQTFIMVFAGLR